MIPSDTYSPDISENLKAFAAFLQHACLDEMIVENFKLVRQMNLPLLTLFAHLSEQELQAMSRISLTEYLEQIQNDTLIEAAKANLDDWQADRLPGISRENVQLKDLVYGYSIRKQIMLKFIPRFTADVSMAVEILSELEQLYIYVEQYAFQLFINIQQEELHRKNEFLHSLIENSVDGIAAYDKDMRVLEWNPELEKRNGIKKEDIIGKSIFAIFPGYANSEEYKLTERVFKGEKVHLSGRPYRYKAGWYEAFLVPLFDNTHVVNSYLSIIRDISERMATEQQLKKQQDELRVLNEELQAQKEELEAGNEELQENLTQLEETQEALTLNEQRLREAQSIAHLGSWEYDLNTHQIYWSQEMKRIFGREETDTVLSLETYFISVHPDDQVQVRNLISKSIQTCISYEYEHRIVLPDSRVRWIYSSGECVFEQEGRNKKLRATCYDITSRKEAEIALEKLNKELEQRVVERTEELSKSEERYRMFLKQSSEGIGRFELEEIGGVDISLPVEKQLALYFQYGYLSECNDALAQMYGFLQASEITSASLGSFLPPDNPVNVAYLRNFITAGYRLSDAETEEVDKEGNAKYFLNNLIGIVEEGRLVRVWCTQRDITNEKIAKEDLRRSEEQLRLITDAVPILITYIDKDLRYRFNNKAYQEWFGIAPESIYGKHMREVLGEEAYNSLQPYITKVFQGERAHFETKLSYRYGGSRFVTGDYIPHIAEKKVAGFYAVIADISNQKSIEEALQKTLNASYDQNQVLARINTDLDNFIYVASHDLRSPVVNLEGIITRLQKQLLVSSESEKILLRLAAEAINRLKQTISDLTEISRVQREIDTNFESVSFPEVFEEVRMDVASLIAESGAVIHTDFQVKNLPYARKNLRSIIYNLLSNAIKYRSPNKTTEIFASTRETEKDIVLTIQDNGLGIPEKQKYKLFTMFKRFHTHVEGSGIGLYILKRIVENYGGQVQVESQEGEGTRFSVFFRKAQEGLSH